MIKQTVLIFCIMMFSGSGYAADIQDAAVSGAFYPGDEKALKKMVDTFLEKAQPGPVDGDIKAIIVPHAGYQYSGQVAAYAFKAVDKRPYKTVVIVGLSHRFGFKGLAVLDKDSYRTPLGDIAIDKEMTKKLLLFSRDINYHKEAFSAEHSAEAEIPFVQETLRGAKIVVILTGYPSYETAMLLRDALTSAIGSRKDVLMVASSDMSHYNPHAEACVIDKETLAAMEQFDPQALFTKLSTMKESSSPCGSTGITGVMMAAKLLGADKVKVLKYATSGDATGDMDAVVGYSATAIYQSGVSMPAAVSSEEAEISSKESDMANMLNQAQRKRLIDIARTTVETFIRTGSIPVIEEKDPLLNQEMGAFVTLNKRGELRGCIGNMVGEGPLYLTVRDMAVAATRDSRFSYDPITVDELKNIDIEVSVLSPMVKIMDPNEILMGKHGVMVRKGFRSGVYLPQVATETGWTREEFMDSLCEHKAGIPADSWKKGNCDIFVFTAEVFGEKTKE